MRGGRERFSCSGTNLHDDGGGCCGEEAGRCAGDDDTGFILLIMVTGWLDGGGEVGLG